MNILLSDERLEALRDQFTRGRAISCSERCQADVLSALVELQSRRALDHGETPGRAPAEPGEGVYKPVGYKYPTSTRERVEPTVGLGSVDVSEGSISDDSKSPVRVLNEVDVAKPRRKPPVWLFTVYGDSYIPERCWPTGNPRQFTTLAAPHRLVTIGEDAFESQSDARRKALENHRRATNASHP